MEDEFKKLQSYASSNNFKEAKIIMLDIENTFKKELHETFIDEFILNAFHESHGFAKFIHSTVNTITFSDAIAECLEILYMLVNTFTDKVIKYTPMIRVLCTTINLTTRPANKVKRRALELLALILAKSDYFPPDFPSVLDLYQTLFNRYEMEADKTTTALVIRTISILVKKYHSRLHLDSLCVSMLRFLKSCIQSKSVAEAAERLNFLCDYLSINPDYELQTIYDCAKHVVQLDVYVKTAHVAALNLLIKHASLFNERMYVDSNWWEEKLQFFLQESKGEIQKTAFLTANVLYQTLAEIMMTKNGDQISTVCDNYLRKFIGRIDESTCHGYELRLAIRGYGYFSKCFKTHLPQEQSTRAFVDMILKIEKVYLLNVESVSGELEYLPDYIQTLSNIIQQLENLSEYEIGILQKATILLIRLYPRLSNHHYDLVVNPILMAYCHIRKNENVKEFLRSIVVDGMIFSCSHAVIYDINAIDDKNDITYKNYLTLWINLLNKPTREFAKWNVKQREAEKVLEELFDEVLKTLLELTSKLNLETEKKEEYMAQTDPELSLRPVRDSDFNIFVNLIDMYVELLTDIAPHRFHKWVQYYLNFNINKANKHPLISGFYKLVAVGLGICNKLNYFSKERIQREDIKAMYDRVVDFINSTIIKIKLYKEDLKVSCLRVVLTAPILYVGSNLKNITPIIVSLFSIARSNLILAKQGLETLEFWQKSFRQTDFEEFLKEILPTLDAYLTSKSLSEKFDPKMLTQRKTKQTLSKRKVVTVSEGDLLQVQKKILSFLGNLSTDVCMALVEGNNSVTPFAKRNEMHLEVKLNYVDFKLPIYLEKFIPRVIELALYCSERKLQITACETLHAIILVLLGKSRIDVSKDLDTLLQIVFYPLLQLGCYPDNTVQQLMKPLVEQLMHWYASPGQRNSKKLAIVIESLIDGVIQTEDSALRDFACVCIHEFVKYSLKHASGRNVEDDVVNVKIVIRKIKQLSYHSDPAKRLAAALIFNNVYTLLREEMYIVDVYWLELFQSVLFNLSKVEENDEYGCLFQILQSVDHIERVFKEKAVLFNKTSKKRRSPSDFSGDTLNCVISAALWYRTTRNRKARSRLYQFYYYLAPSVPNQSKYLTEIHYPRLNTPLEWDNLTSKDVLDWLKRLLFALDTELSIYEHEKQQHIYGKDASLFEGLEVFLKNIEPNSVHTFNILHKNIISKPLDQEQFKNMKEEITKNAIRYLVVASYYEEHAEIEELFKNYVATLLCEFIFTGITFVDDLEHETIIDDIFKKIKGEGVMCSFKAAVHDHIRKNSLPDLPLDKNVPLKQRQLFRGLMVLRKSTVQESINIDIYLRDILENVFKKLTREDDDTTYAIKLTSSAKKYCSLIVDLYLESKDFSFFSSKLCNQKFVNDLEKNKTTTFGRFIYESFKEIIIKHLFENFTKFIEVAELADDDQYFFTTEVLKYALQIKKNVDVRLIEAALETILSKWVTFRTFYESDIKNKITGLQLLEKISSLATKYDIKLSSVKDAFTWILSCFNFKSYTILPQKLYQHLVQIFHALPIILKHEESRYDESWSNFRNNLDLIQEKYFTEIDQSLDVAAILSINKSFEISIISTSKSLFLFSCKIFIVSHLRNDIDTEKYCQFYVQKVSEDMQYALIIEVFEICSNLRLTLNDSYQMVDIVLVSLLRHVKYDVFEKFFVSVIKTVDSNLNGNDDSEDLIVKKTISYILLKSLFSRINTEKIDNMTCPITNAVCSAVNDGKELIRSSTKVASSYLKEKINETLPDTTKEFLRICKCQCYNALNSIITNTITSESSNKVSYYTLLFSREIRGENMLWKNIIDPAKKYSFPIVFATLPTETKKLVNIRTQHQAKSNSNIKYIESQTIFDSTLSEDVSLYDFSKSIIRSQPFDYIQNRNEVEMEITIDGEEINGHECMANICGLIKKIHLEKIYDDSELPKWVELINKELQNENCPANVKLFLLKIIEKEQVIFKQFANMLHQSIVELLVNKIVGDNINYFVADLIVMLTSWSDSTTTENSVSITKLLQFLMENVNQDRSDLKRYHLNLIKLVVESWKDCIVLPVEYICSQLDELKASKKVTIVINFCSIFLANDLCPWNSKTLKLFAKTLVGIVDDVKTTSTQRESCAETIGMALKYLSDRGDDSVQNFLELVAKKYKKIDFTKSLACLQATMKHYPQICDNFINLILHKFHQTKAKGICLKIFLERIDSLHNSVDFQTIDLKDLINDYDVQFKALGIEIIRKTLPKVQIIGLKENHEAKLKISRDYFLSLIDEVSKFATNDDQISRSIVFDLFMDISDDDYLSDIEGLNVKVTDALLQGLTDNNEEIRKKIIDFWRRKLPPNVSSRFHYILKNMYKPNIEEKFLSYAVNFLLEELDTSEKLFDRPLEDLTFQECDITDNWRSRHSTLAPLFASTYRSQESSSGSIRSNEYYLRATGIGMEFEPTAKPDTLDYQKRELFSQNIEIVDDGEEEHIFKTPLPVTDKIYKRRFKKNQSQLDRDFALRKMTEKVTTEKARRDSIKQRQEGANIYRKYRIGEVPDIEITLSDVILPLRKLFENDSQLAQIFYTSFFEEVLNKAKKEISETYLGDVAHAMENIFKNSVLFNTYLMGALLDVAIRSRELMNFSPEIVSKVCLNSGLISSGILLLEEYLISHCDYDIPAKRNPSVSSSPETKYYIKLADMYRELADWDIVKAIFLSKMDSDDSVIQAIDAESQGLWRDAQCFYHKVIQKDLHLDRRDFYYESYFKCLAELSDWDALSTSIKDTVSDDNLWDDLWDQDWNQEKLLPWYITAEIRSSLFCEDKMKHFMEILNKAMADSTKSDHIKVHFSEEIAFLYLVSENIAKASFYARNNLERFLEDWQNLSPMLTFLRRNKLLKIRNTVDLYNFISKVNGVNKDVLRDNVRELCDQWLKISNEKVTSIVPLETKNIYRTECLATLKSQSIEGFDTLAENIKFELDMQLVDTAIKMRHFHVARKYLEGHSEYGEKFETESHVKYMLNCAKIHGLRAFLSNVQASEKIPFYIKACEYVKQCFDSPAVKNSIELTLRTTSMYYNFVLEVARAVDKSTENFNGNFKEIFTEFNDYSKEGFENHAVRYMERVLNSSRQGGSFTPTTNATILSEMGNAYVQLAQYAERNQNSGRFKTVLITSVLRAMSYDSPEARQMFPCLLDIKDIGTIYKDVFLKECNGVPEWFFIQWIPQLLSKLDSSCVYAIDKIILKLATAYPQSIMYAYKLSKEKYCYKLDDDTMTDHFESVLRQLDVLLNNKYANDIIGALCSVCTAENVLYSHIIKLRNVCNERNEIAFKKHVESFERFCSEQMDCDEAKKKMGPVHKRVLDLAKDLRQLRTAKFIPEKILQHLSGVCEKTKQAEYSQNERSKRFVSRLSYYSPFLEYYMDNQLNYDDELEIPGQYGSDRKPLPQYHTKIAGFNSEVLIMKSLRKPIRIKIIGNDGREYSFLVKVGEDLRQDQRIEQMFSLMNNTFDNNAACREHRLKISTYQVIPLTCNLGLIQWVDNTQDMKTFLLKSVPECSKTKLENLMKTHQTKYTGKVNPGKDNYEKALSKHDAVAAALLYRELVNKLPYNIFRKALETLSINSESFITLRTNFITSYVSSCIGNWILGIGDRHSGNTLLCLDTARTIEIDFGHAFGSGVQIQAVPELVPFRLTPHIIDLMQPLQENGLIEETMIHVLRALRKNRNSLISTVKVFVNEPSMDWVQYKKFENEILGYNWCPQEKMAHTKMKLNGCNSVYVMINELKNRTRDTQAVIEKYVEYVKGSEENVRTRLEDTDLSVEDQVKCLLNHATDPNLLCRMYYGWEPWI